MKLPQSRIKVISLNETITNFRVGTFNHGARDCTNVLPLFFFSGAFQITSFWLQITDSHGSGTKIAPDGLPDPRGRTCTRIENTRTP